MIAVANHWNQSVPYNPNILLLYCILPSRRCVRCTQQRQVLDDSCSWVALLATPCWILPSSIQEWNRGRLDLFDIHPTRSRFVSCGRYRSPNRDDLVRPKHAAYAIHPKEEANRFHSVVLSRPKGQGPTAMLVLAVSCSYCSFQQVTVEQKV